MWLWGQGKGIKKKKTILYGPYTFIKSVWNYEGNDWNQCLHFIVKETDVRGVNG